MAVDNTATITIDVDSTPVTNGANASWQAGENILTVKVEVTGETAYYKVLVTKTS